MVDLDVFCEFSPNIAKVTGYSDGTISSSDRLLVKRVHIWALRIAGSELELPNRMSLPIFDFSELVANYCDLSYFRFAL